MGSITPHFEAPQGRKVRSIAEVRNRATKGARGKWSARHVLAVVQSSGAYGLAAHVLMTMLLLADGEPNLSGKKMEEIGDAAGLSRDSVRWHIKQLRDLGAISIDVHRGKGSTNVYQLDPLDRPTTGGAA